MANQGNSQLGTREPKTTASRDGARTHARTHRGGGTSRAGVWTLLVGAGLLAACGSSDGPGGSASDPNGGTGDLAPPGTELKKPDGTSFIVDSSEGGQASEFRIERMFFGRLVEVYDYDAFASGGPVSTFQYQDFVIGEDVGSDGVNFEVETNAVTQRTRLTILRKNDPTRSDDEFDQLLSFAEESARPIASQAIESLPPFPLLARNATLVLRMSDALDHATIQNNTVRVLTGNPPIDPFDARIIPDPNHGILARLADGTVDFRSTRVLIDMTVSELESEELVPPVAPNSLGLPASPTAGQANVAVRIPARIDFASGQFQRLENVSGHGISISEAENGPIDTELPTMDAVRAMRSGNATDVNNGFMRDLRPPQVVGEQTLTVVAAADDPSSGSVAGFDFLVNLDFDSIPCAPRPRPEDVLSLAGGFFEVIDESAPAVAGQVDGVRVRSLQAEGTKASTLVGGGTYLSTFRPALGDQPECFVSFIPAPQEPPAAGLDPMTQIRVRFSEPMDPARVTAFDNFMVVTEVQDPLPTEVVVGKVVASADLQTFTYTPVVPLPHEMGTSERYSFAMAIGTRNVVDLAGNELENVLPDVDFTLRNQAEPSDTGGYVLRFSTRDEDQNSEVDSDGQIVISRPEVRGQFLYNLDEGIIRPRPVSRFQAVADRSHPVTSLMNAFPPGVQTPLAPLGSKLMHVWRYCDFNFALNDETLYNIDVEGLSWAPKNGQVVADNYEDFRIRLAHSNRLPDEYLGPTTNLPEYQDSGLLKGQFESRGPNGNILEDPLNHLTIVHSKEKGYEVSPAEIFTSESGTKLVPYPLNQGAKPEDFEYYTWRDSAILAEGGPEGVGADLHVLVTAGLITDEERGFPYTTLQVPSIALPLLMEYSCFPSDSAVGLNAFDVSLAINSSGQPNFRLFATGGIDSSGTPVTKDPDLETKASGGFNPANNGSKTKGFDVVFYHGAIDAIVRVSRATTIWIDAGEPTTPKDWLDPVVEPRGQSQPLGTSILLAFRGANDVPLSQLPADPDPLSPTDANTYDIYGDAILGADWGGFGNAPDFVLGDTRWTDTIHDVDGAPYVQVRMTFVGNPISSLTPELSALGLGFARM